jgi:phosphoribosyl isomerase A
VIASGGVSTIADIRALAEIPGVEGVIVGKALYERSFDLPRAITAGRGEA